MGLGNIGVNIHSATLSRALQPEENNEKNPQNKDSTASENNSLDLSGTFNVHISSPHDDDDCQVLKSRSAPLFRLGKRSKKYPSVRLGANYDFGERWFGLTRILSTFSWDSFRFSNSSKKNKIPTSPMNIILSTEAGLIKHNDYSLELTLQQRQHHNGLNLLDLPTNEHSTISARIDSYNTQATFSFQKPINRSFSLISISTFCFANWLKPRLNHSSSLQHASRQTLSGKMPPTNDPDSVIPKFRLGVGGNLITSCEKGWINIPSTDQTSKGTDDINTLFPGLLNRLSRTGIRFVIRKQLDWNLSTGLGLLSSNIDAEDDVSFRLEIMGLEADQKVLNSFIFDSRGSDISDFLENTHFSFAREQIIDLSRQSELGIF